ncbi:ABC transporter permease [Actinobaculum sp. 352]|uniref:ABC transporter permease n=1 Tax=Actinobaculum sp. 352 TaxID=2490946 RepID=UPI000F7E6196|nr:ABC transporter permease [Actinobaculum sp. 352]RTE47786.1 ABC transporter permease [Actinobaculum sp. 352]
MIRLLITDLRHHAGMWLWTFVVAVVAGACVFGQFAAGQGMETAIARYADESYSTTPLTVFCLITVGVSAISVLSSTASRVVEMRTRDFGLWRALGMRPGAVRATLLGELAILGGIAGLVGVPLGYGLAHVLVPMLISERVAPPQTVPELPPAALCWAVLFTAAVAVLGGWWSAARCARARESLLLRGESAGGSRVGSLWRVLGRLLLLAGLCAGIVAAYMAIRDGVAGSDEVISAAMPAALAFMCVVLLLVRWCVPLLERLAARLIPRSWVAAFVAGRTCAVESSRSSATVLPFALAMGLVGVLYSGRNFGMSGVTAQGFLAMFGPALLVAWTGGVAIIAMSAGQRRRDGALLAAAGARHGTILVAEVLEGVIHSLVAALLGVAITVGAVYLVGLASAVPFSEALPRAPWEAIGIVVTASFVTVCLAVVVSSRVGARATTLGQMLRAQE